MRDIKFRAKSKRCFPQRWIYGDLLQPTMLLFDNYEISDHNSVDGNRYDIDPETIGQYTGLKDKNGTEIYEGDIVTSGDKNIRYVVEWIDTGLKARQTGNKSYIVLNAWKDTIEVIGNIYDNPELLKEE